MVTPGGNIHPFCDAVIATSTLQRSTGRSMEPMELTPSTTSRRLWRLTTSARERSGLVTPVEVSLWVTSTVGLSGSCWSGAARALGFVAWPEVGEHLGTSGQ